MHLLNTLCQDQRLQLVYILILKSIKHDFASKDTAVGLLVEWIMAWMDGSPGGFLPILML